MKKLYSLLLLVTLGNTLKPETCHVDAVMMQVKSSLLTLQEKHQESFENKLRATEPQTPTDVEVAQSQAMSAFGALKDAYKRGFHLLARRIVTTFNQQLKKLDKRLRPDELSYDLIPDDANILVKNNHRLTQEWSEFIAQVDNDFMGLIEAVLTQSFSDLCTHMHTVARHKSRGFYGMGVRYGAVKKKIDLYRTQVSFLVRELLKKNLPSNLQALSKPYAQLITVWKKEQLQKIKPPLAA